MRIQDFDYKLPPELIAREPVRPRDASRMMVLDRRTERYIDSTFRSLPEFLEPSDVLVINDTRVMRARIYGTLERIIGTTRKIEVLFAAPASENVWEVMCRPGKRIRRGDRVVFGNVAAEGVFGESRPHGLRLLHWKAAESVESFLETHGRVPLPPYIGRADTAADATEYQTVYAKSLGAIAAPTAGLHFTEAIFDALQQRGIEILKITLHVGVGTFLPVRTDDPRKHVLKPECFEIGPETAARLNDAREGGRRIVAVGTTTTRALEYVVHRFGRFEPGGGNADLFILPGHEFRAVGALLTNFHLPRSTLLMLVSAFASRSLILDACRHATGQGYRFYSYGDCMLIV